MASDLVPHLGYGYGATNFGNLGEVYEHLATFMSSREVAMLAMTSKEEARPWKHKVARNSAALGTQCDFHTGSPWQGHTILDVFLCGCCEEKVCDLCIRKGGRWCKGTPVRSCPGYDMSDEGRHSRTPICNLCTLNDRQLCASCHMEYEKALFDMTGDNSDVETNTEGSDAETGEEEADEEFWSDENMLD